MKRTITLITAVLLLAACTAQPDLSKVAEATSEQISVVEPPCWWTGMKTQLQLLVHGEGIGSSEVSISGKGLKVTGTHAAESPNYIFVDVEVAPNAAPGTYWLVFENEGRSFKYPYEIAARRAGSADRQSFTTADLIYLIMPDRFANGDPSNDSTDDTKDKAAREQAFGRHGGDIQGMMDHLDYIAGLGATAIWCTPLLEDDDPRGSYHGYAASNYYRIDPRFGDNDLYREFVAKAHGHGLKMVMDIVTNHSGTNTHWWAKDLPFNDWLNQWPSYTGSNYVFTAHMDPNASQKDLKGMQEGWFTRGMADMNLDNPYLLNYFKQWAVWWIEWADLDGFRVDTYPYNEKEPMSEWCKAVLEEYPGFNIVGECWDSRPAVNAYFQKDNLNHDGFNSYLPSIMDFPVLDAANAVFSPRHSRMRTLYDAFAYDFVYKDLSHMLVFSSNHDTRRIGDVVGKNPDKFKLMMTLFATTRGIMQIFSGDEMMFSSADLKQGDGGLRVDFPGGWEGDEFDFFTPEGRAAADKDFDGTAITKGMREDLYSYCSTLFNWRKGCTAIHNGKTMHFVPKGDAYAYFRYNDTSKVFVFLNNSDTESAVVPWEDYSEITSGLVKGTDVISGKTVDFSQKVEVAPLTSLVVEFK